MIDEKFYYKKDRLNQLRGFCAIVQTGSMNKAAAKLGVEPPTISKQIIALERDTGLKLFDRELTKRRLKITTVGQEFFNKAVTVLQEVEGLFNYYSDQKLFEKDNTIKIAVHHTAINYLMPKYVQEFRKYDKKTKLIIYNLKIQEAIEKLKNEEIDLLLHIVDNIPPELTSKAISIFEPIILMNKNNILANKKDKDITFEDLTKQNMIMIDKNNIIRYFVDTCSEYNLKGNIEFVNGDWEMVRNFVKLNLGIHMYSAIYNKFEDFKDDKIITKNIKHLFPAMKLQIVVKKGKIYTKSIKNFLDIILKDLIK